MTKFVTYAFLISLLCCLNKSSEQTLDEIKIYKTQSGGVSRVKIADNMIFPFFDKTYELILRTANSNTVDENRNNSTLIFRRVQNGVTKNIFTDSLYCLHAELKLCDFNNDKIKDVLIFHSTGGRANPTYHLYLVDTVNHRLNYVKRFKNLPNPDLDSANNIISSYALAGSEILYNFFRITSKSKLINLGHGFETNISDTTAYEKAIKLIIKDKKE